MTTPALTVVVPTYQRRDRALQLLRALGAQTLAASDFETVVCIDGSTDGTREALASFEAPYALYLVEQENRGRASARNAAIRMGRGEILVMLDDDMEPAPGCLEAHLAAHRGHDRRGVLGAVPIRVAPDAPAASRYIAQRFNGHMANLERANYRMLLTDFYSGNFSVRRDVLAEAGGFDETFTEYGNEDLELSWRLARAGVSFTYEPAALAHQHHDKDFAALARDRMAEGRTAVQFARKHPSVFEELRLGHFDTGSRALRFLRNAMLRARGLASLVVRIEPVVARLPGSATFYDLALNWFYWLGVRAALSAPPPGGEPAPLAALARRLGA